MSSLNWVGAFALLFSTACFAPTIVTQVDKIQSQPPPVPTLLPTSESSPIYSLESSPVPSPIPSPEHSPIYSPIPSPTPSPESPPQPDPTANPGNSVATALEYVASKNWDELGTNDFALSSNITAEVSQALWEKYKRTQLNNSVRLLEHQNSQIQYNNKVMIYTSFKIGQPSLTGYPLYIALHGGGGTTAQANDNQWEQMKYYYKGSVTKGIYVAPRAVTNTWDLHFQPESYVMYDRLIENMILFENVDPNQVYILGYSAGGDGTYQIPNRMPDRWAAANMSAGHPNGVSMVNLYHVPFLIQVGEKDTLYDRHKMAATYHGILNSLKDQNPDGYDHETFIHYDKPHNFIDNNSIGLAQTVLANVSQWLSTNLTDRTTTLRDANAIHWISPHLRNPLPQRVIWDLTTRANREASSFWTRQTHGQQNYWLDVGPHTATSLGINNVSASIDSVQNLITVHEAKTYLRILVSGKLLDLSRSIRVKVGNQEWNVLVPSNLRQMVNTLTDRGDPNFIFEGQITLTQRPGGQWELSTDP